MLRARLRAPDPADPGAAVSHDSLTLEAADGNVFAAFRATPDEPAATGIVILPDVRGLYRFYEELALRFAERGYVAIAIDYFGRTAGAEKRDDDFEYMPHVQQTKPDLIQADVARCVRDLRGRGCTSIFTVGFCMGGRQSWLAAASGHGLTAPPASTAIRASGTACPARSSAPPRSNARSSRCRRETTRTSRREDNAQFDEALREAGVDHEVIVYEGAPHSFFDRKQEQFADASEDAWRRVLAFLERYA